MSQITLTFEAGDGVNFSVVKPERYTLDGLLLTGTFNTADGIATADNGAQTGEERLTNFMLWQLAYTEFYFTDVLWPDFNKKELIKAIEYYNGRDRRFGGI